jgi:hypothetical protein
MSERVRATDWGATPLGDTIRWGPQFIHIHNDAYRAILGAKAPGGVRQTARRGLAGSPG